MTYDVLGVCFQDFLHIPSHVEKFRKNRSDTSYVTVGRPQAQIRRLVGNGFALEHCDER